MRRFAVIPLVLALSVAGLMAGPAASAAKVAFAAAGSVRCSMVGTHSIKPGLTYAAKAGVVQKFRGKLTCTTGTTGVAGVTVTTGRIKATSAVSTISCNTTALPTFTAKITWKAKGGKVKPTQITWHGATTTTSPRVVKSYPGTGAVVTGSYARGAARAHVVSDRVGQPACNNTNGLKGFKFSGVGGASTFEIPTTATAQGSGTPLFSDEFSGASLDLVKWRPNWLGPSNGAITKPVNTAEESCYDPAQVSVSGGYLHLEAVNRSCTANNGISYPYASGLIESRNSFTFTYGHLEARVWFPPGSGATQNWGAFWADGTGTFPTTGELDVVEALNGRACYHFHSTSGDPGGCSSLADPAGWHTFAADWRSGSVTWFYDGTQVGRVTSGITGAPMFLILNLAVSSSISAPIVVPSEMLVDYVRITS